jgi:hypothetical protein
MVMELHGGGGVVVDAMVAKKFLACNTVLIRIILKNRCLPVNSRQHYVG